MQTNAPPIQSPKGIMKWLYAILAILLWLATAVFGLVEIPMLRDIVTAVFMNLVADRAVLALITYILIPIAGLGWLVYTIGTAEVHLKAPGGPRSWPILAWAIAIELLILILYYIVT